MHTYKLASRGVPKSRTTNAIFKRSYQAPPTRKMSMSLFPRSFISDFQHSSPSTASSSFHPLFRLLDDFDNYRTVNASTNVNSLYQSHFSDMRTFSPKFDVREVGDVYELHGELPGIAQKDVEIEFSDENTLTIKGRTERSYMSPDEGEEGGAITVDESGNTTKAIDDTESTSSSRKERQATVEDENEIASSEKHTTGIEQHQQQIAKVTLSQSEKELAQKKDQQLLKPKYWVSERSMGEFARSFTFPVRVDQENVKAKMLNGVLSVAVPKAKKVETRRIVIE